MKRVLHFMWSNFELIFWISALTLLFFMSPEASHFTLCPIKNLGYNFCPGCGLGHSLHHAMVFDFRASFTHHPLGIFALIVLFTRIYTLIKNLIKTETNEFNSFTTHSGR